MAILQIIGLSGENNSLYYQANYLWSTRVYLKKKAMSNFFPSIATEQNSSDLLFAYFSFTDNVKINQI